MQSSSNEKEVSMRSISVFLCLLISATPLLADTNPACGERVLTGTVPLSVQAPGPGVNRVNVSKSEDGGPLTPALSFPVNNGLWTVDQATMDLLRVAVAGASPADRRLIRLAWFEGNAFTPQKFRFEDESATSVCGESQPVAPINSPSPPSPTMPTTNTPSDGSAGGCTSIFQRVRAEVERKLGRTKHYTALLLTSNGEAICARFPPDGGTEGDPIYVAVVNQDSLTSPQVTFTKCDLQSPIPKGLPAPEGGFGALTQQSAGPDHILFEPRRCFGPEVSFTYKAFLGGPVEKTYPLQQYERFRYTFQASTLATPQHSNSFGLRPDGTTMRIFNRGPIDRGPEYAASVVLYAIPRYFSHLFNRNGEPYYGRDIVNDHEFQDRIGAVFGVGLTSPNDRFIAGLSFELFTGVNIIGVYEFARVKDLAGVSEGDVFSDTADKIP